MAVAAGITRVAKNVLWVGINDWSLREFHSMQAPIGTSYNSYVIECAEPTVVDCVKHTLARQWIDNLKTLFGPDLKCLKNVLVQHAEPDHTSALPILLKEAPHVTLLGSRMCINTLKQFYGGQNWHAKEIAGPYRLGDQPIVTVGVPMAHWPESSVTYLPDKRVLFTNDAFGQHIASTKRFLDEIDPALWTAQAKQYFANILLPLERPVLSALKAAGCLAIDIALPSHGVGYRTPDTLGLAIESYVKWATQEKSKKVVVLFDENWFGTGRMAESVAAGVGAAGADVRVLHARRTHITETATELVDAAAVAVGSATLHCGVLPDLAQHLCYLKALSIKQKIGAIFGTYGWQRDAVPKDVRRLLFEPARVEELTQPVMAHWNPQASDLKACEELGRTLGAKAMEIGK